jgi:hypothetical protein
VARAPVGRLMADWRAQVTAKLPTMAEEAARRGAPQKGSTALRRDATEGAKATRTEVLNDTVYARDERKSRATGKPLMRRTTNARQKWTPHHLRKRSTHPEKKYDPDNVVSLSLHEHQLAETRCPKNTKLFMLDIEGDNAGKKHTLLFIRRNEEGTEIWRRSS